jgi:PAS domain S-box-containing protein
VVKLVREELRVELRALLRTVREAARPLDSKPIDVQFNGHCRPVVMHLRPSLQRDEEGLVLVIFEERDAAPEPPGGEIAASPGNHQTAELEEEIHQLRRRLQASIEEFESSQEEMKASNEEMQSVNEELRSTLEELETSKEELQSINEELQTVNQENRHKVEELSQLTSDLHNLLSATDIATLFLDRDLRILRFTPKLGELFNVRQTDRGRPISDLTARIGYPELRTDAAQVLGRLSPIERELRDEAGRWYLTRVLPYRSGDDKIEGVVITFVDITTRKEAEEAARASEARLSAELQAMQRLHSLVARLIVTPDLATALQDVLESAVEITGADMGNIQVYNRARRTLEIVAQRGFDRAFLEHFRNVNVDGTSSCGRALASRRRVVIPDVTADPLFEPHLQAAAAAGFRAVQSTPLMSRDGRVLGVLSTHYVQARIPSDRDLRLLDLYTQQATDYIDRRRADEEISTSLSARNMSEQRYQELFDSIDEGLCIIELEVDATGHAHDYRFLKTNPAFDKHSGFSNAVGRTMRELAPEHEPMWLETFGRIARSGSPERFEERADMLGRYLDVYAFRTGRASEHRIAVLLRDVTERRATEERQKMLMSELNHRVKNTLATVQSIANQTMVTVANTADFVEKFRGRLATLSEAHDLLAQASWEGAELSGILYRLVSGDGDGERIGLSGPVVVLPPQAALTLSLILYELVTNARKYGALSQPEGRVRVGWRVEARNGERHLDLDWIERDGPFVKTPETSGFGRALIEQSLAGIGGRAELEFRSGGVSCRIVLPLPPPRG